MTGHAKQFVVYKDQIGEWRWTLFAANSKKIADGAEGYKRIEDCVHGARLVASIASGAGVWNRIEDKWL